MKASYLIATKEELNKVIAAAGVEMKRLKAMGVVEVLFEISNPQLMKSAEQALFMFNAVARTRVRIVPTSQGYIRQPIPDFEIPKTKGRPKKPVERSRIAVPLNGTLSEPRLNEARAHQIKRMSALAPG